MADFALRPKTWRALVFGYEHEAWNRTDGARAAFAGVVKQLGSPGSLVNWLVLNAGAFTPCIRKGDDRHREWERAFHRGRDFCWMLRPLASNR